MNSIPSVAAIGLGGPELLLILIILVFLAFWVWMIVDCATNETDAGSKVAWMLVIILVGVIGAPLYFFVRKLPRRGA